MEVWKKDDAIDLLGGVMLILDHGPELHFFFVDSDGVAKISTDVVGDDAPLIALMGDMGWHASRDVLGEIPRTVWSYEIPGNDDR